MCSMFCRFQRLTTVRLPFRHANREFVDLRYEQDLHPTGSICSIDMSAYVDLVMEDYLLPSFMHVPAEPVVNE